MFPSFIIFLWVSTIASLPQRLPDYHQTDYDFKFERAEIVWIHPSYARDVKVEFPFYNRSQRVVNATSHLLVDLMSLDLVGEMQILKFMSNEYRYFPITVSANLCEEYAHNRFNLRELRKKMITNAPDGCPFKKGFYYAYNFLFDYSTLPPLIPRGRYKAVMKMYYVKEFVGEAHAYAEIKDKPIEWWKL